MDNEIFKSVDEYIAFRVAKEDTALQKTSTSVREANVADISISPVQGKMLQVFAAACSAKRILELGTFFAYSTIWLARALPLNGKLISIEIDEHQTALAQKNIDNAQLSHLVELRTGKAIDIFQEMINSDEPPFDLIFVDADKPPYLEYFKLAIKLSRPGTIIICDNVIRNGAVLDENATDEKVIGVQRLNNYLSTCNDIVATILQTVGAKEYDGMVMAVVK
nr:O-methyltransferase [Bacteroidota bacterium]